MRLSGAPFLALLFVVLALASMRVPDENPVRLLDLAVSRGRAMPERCEIARDSREASVLRAGEEFVVDVRAPAGGRLRYAVGAPDPAVAVPPWRLTVEDAEHPDRILADDHAPALSRWDERTLDLRAFAGRRLRVRARAEPAAQGNTERLCLAHPVLASHQRAGHLTIVVLLDTLRADHLSLYRYARRTAPALETLAGDGVTFDDAASDASWTRASVATLFTGEPALGHGVLARDAHLGPALPTLAERFRRAGVHTVALSTNPNVLPFWGFARGFERFVDVGAEEWTQNADAARVLAIAREVVHQAGSEPTLLYVHINDAHAPYDPPPEAARALLGTYDPASPGSVINLPATAAVIASAIDRYDGEIAYLDAQLGAFFADLKASGQYRRSLIVVVGDHGEEFLDHGGLYHGHTLFREQLHVPLIVKLPGLAGAGSRVAAAARVEDVLPTMLAIQDLPIDGLPGRPLLDANGHPRPGASLPRFAATDLDDATAYAVEDEDWTLIVQTRPSDRQWLFARAADPLQVDELAGTHPFELARLQALLDDRLLALRAGWHVRVCGGAAPLSTRLAITSAAPVTAVERIELEDTDRLEIAPDGRGLALALDLQPQLRPEELFGKLVPRTRPDRDEVVFASPGPLGVTIEGASIPILVGGNGERLAEPLTALSREAAESPAVYAPPCTGAPAAFVWHAGSHAAAAPVDPDIARRLRALGYLP